MTINVKSNRIGTNICPITYELAKLICVQALK